MVFQVPTPVGKLVGKGVRSQPPTEGVSVEQVIEGEFAGKITDGSRNPLYKLVNVREFVGQGCTVGPPVDHEEPEPE